MKNAAGKMADAPAAHVMELAMAVLKHAQKAL